MLIFGHIVYHVFKVKPQRIEKCGAIEILLMQHKEQ